MLGPEDSTIVQYAREFRCAEVVTELNREALAEAIRRLASGEQYRHDLASRAHQAFEANHNVRRHQERLKEVVRRVVASGSSTDVENTGVQRQVLICSPCHQPGDFGASQLRQKKTPPRLLNELGRIPGRSQDCYALLPNLFRVHFDDPTQPRNGPGDAVAAAREEHLFRCPLDIHLDRDRAS